MAEKRFVFAPVGRNLRKILGEEKLFSPPKKITANNLRDIFKDFLGSKKTIHLEEKTIERQINIEEKIFSLRQALIERIKVSFNEFLLTAKSKTEIVVSFLAVLELMKQKDLSVDQEGLFAEILISRKE